MLVVFRQKKGQGCGASPAMCLDRLSLWLGYSIIYELLDDGHFSVYFSLHLSFQVFCCWRSETCGNGGQLLTQFSLLHTFRTSHVTCFRKKKNQRTKKRARALFDTQSTVEGSPERWGRGAGGSAGERKPVFTRYFPLPCAVGWRHDHVTWCASPQLNCMVIGLPSHVTIALTRRQNFPLHTSHYPPIINYIVLD